MFTVSAKGVYGLAALMDLAESYQSGPRQIRDIAVRHDIPQHYLEQILVALKKGGIVESYRGAQGGYALAAPPSQIRIDEALSLLEGKIEVISEQKRDSYSAFYWIDLESHIQKYLAISLEELLADHSRKNPTHTWDI